MPRTVAEIQEDLYWREREHWVEYSAPEHGMKRILTLADDVPNLLARIAELERELAAAQAETEMWRAQVTLRDEEVQHWQRKALAARKPSAAVRELVRTVRLLRVNMDHNVPVCKCRSCTALRAVEAEIKAADKED